MISESQLNINNNENSSQKLGSKKLKLNYNIKLLPENETNNLTYIKSIKRPNEAKINEALNPLDFDIEYLYNNIENNYIDTKYIFIRKIIGDGNCYFRSLSFYFTNSHNYYHYFRNYIYNHIKNNEKYYLNEFPFINILLTLKNISK